MVGRLLKNGLATDDQKGSVGTNLLEAVSTRVDKTDASSVHAVTCPKLIAESWQRRATP
jgi:hypothetical protein